METRGGKREKYSQKNERKKEEKIKKAIQIKVWTKLKKYS